MVKDDNGRLFWLLSLFRSSASVLICAKCYVFMSADQGKYFVLDITVSKFKCFPSDTYWLQFESILCVYKFISHMFDACGLRHLFIDSFLFMSINLTTFIRTEFQNLLRLKWDAPKWIHFSINIVLCIVPSRELTDDQIVKKSC